MPLIRFDANNRIDDPVTAPAQLIRFLTAHPAHPSLITEVIQQADSGLSDQSLYVMVRPLKPSEAFVPESEKSSPAEVLQQSLKLYNGEITDATELGEQADWHRDNLDAFIEHIALAPHSRQPDPGDVILMVEADHDTVEQTINFALHFISGSPGSLKAISSKNGAERPVYILHMRDLTSSYPLHQWLSMDNHRLFYSADPAGGLYVQAGFRYPFTEVVYLHSRFASQEANRGMVLISRGNDGQNSSMWHHIDDAGSFLPIAQIGDIHLVGRTSPISIEHEEHTSLRSFSIPLSLQRTSGTEPGARRSSPQESGLFQGQPLKDRIRTLEIQRTRIERELVHLKELEQSHFICLFTGESAEAIGRFASDYPLSRLRHFLYLPCRHGDGDEPAHLLISKEGAGRADLPGEISQQGELYYRDPNWHALGVDVYLPDQYVLRPVIGFDNSTQLLRAFESSISPEELIGKIFILKPGDGEEIDKWIIPYDEAQELTDSIQYINTMIYTRQMTSMIAGAAETQLNQYMAQYEAAVSRLTEAQQILQKQFDVYIEGLDADLHEALNDLEYRQEELNDYASARQAMITFCQSVRDLVQQPGNNLFAFLRKETDLNRRLADQLNNIDYRYNIQYESYEHQINQIFERSHDGFKQKLADLFSKIDREGRSLQEQTDTLRKELERYADIPDDIKRQLDNITHMHNTIRSYLSTTGKMIK